MSELFEWDKKSTLDLIEMYKQNEMLWNPKHRDYKNKLIRINTLKQIAARMNVDKSEIERKFRNMSSHYLRELKKERYSEKGGGVPFKSIWFAYEAMEFMKNRTSVVQRRIKGLDQAQLIDGDETSQNSDDSTTEHTNTEYKFLIPEVKSEDPLTEPFEETRLLETTSSSREESSTFGEYIASKVRSMDKRTKAIVEYEINSIIFKAEMGFYRDKKYDVCERSD